ncbi:MAG TPA: hypothetical protein VMU84_08475 [Thermoanaerobaculia bacterium]|nr:hypothetical protein [Thermoanaerobaculia bacterium]
MTNEALAPLTAEGVKIVPRYDGNTLHVAISGAIEMRDPGQLLTPYWTSLDEYATHHSIHRVELDMRDLTFMNSSGILTLVRWITKAKTHDAQSAYKLVLQYDRNVTWQRTSIPTLAKLAPEVVVPAEINGY